MIAWFNYSATLKIMVFSLLVGGALPALFAVGVRLSAAGSPSSEGVEDPAARQHPLLRVLSWAVYATVLAAVALAVLFIARDFLAHRFGWHVLGGQAAGAGP